MTLNGETGKINKKIFLILLFTIAVSSCSNNKEQAEIKNYMKANMNDPSSYEPVRFETIQNDSIAYFNDPMEKVLLDSQGYWLKLISKENDETYRDDSVLLASHNPFVKLHSQEKAIALMDSFHRSETALNLFEKNYEGKPCGFKTRHVFRKKNRSGALVLDSVTFYFDSSMVLKDKNYAKYINDD